LFNLNSVLIGQYRHGDTVIHKVDPRFKIIWTIIIMAVIAFTLDLVVFAGLTVYLIVLFALAKISPRRILPVLKMSILLFLITFILHVVFAEPGGTVYLSIWGMDVSSKGLTNGLMYSYRIFLFLLSAAVLNLTTSPLDISDGLLRLIRPLRHLRIPVNDISMMLFIALRFIPVLSDEARTIHAAQVSRGMKVREGPMGRFKSLLPLMLPMLVGVVRRAEQLAIAIESRGYRSETLRTSFREFRVAGRDVVFGLTLVVVLAGSIMVNRSILF